jgi:hypothetical protein
MTITGVSSLPEAINLTRRWAAEGTYTGSAGNLAIGVPYARLYCGFLKKAEQVCGEDRIRLEEAQWSAITKGRQSLIHAGGVWCRGCGSVRTMSGSSSGE